MRRIANLCAENSPPDDKNHPNYNFWDNYQPEYTTDGEHIIFASQMGGLVSALWIMNTDVSHKRQLTAPPLEASGADMAPNGKHMVFYSQQTRIAQQASA